jgi:peroxiredoxin
VELQNRYESFRAAGTEVVALLIAAPESVQEWYRDAELSYPVLADSAHQVAELYNVYNLLGDGLTAPAAFIVTTDGHVEWGHIGWRSGDQPDPETILAHLPQRKES